MNYPDYVAFAENYTRAWCSQNAASVAEFFASDGSLTINDGAPAVGRKAITESAQSFMSAFPDLVVTMNNFMEQTNGGVYHWTLTGTNTGPNGTGRAVRIVGYEQWTLDNDGLVVHSLGYFDQADYERQLQL